MCSFPFQSYVESSIYIYMFSQFLLLHHPWDSKISTLFHCRNSQHLAGKKMGLLFSRQLKNHPTTVYQILRLCLVGFCMLPSQRCGVPQKLRPLFASRRRYGVPDLFISRHACTKLKRSSPNVQHRICSPQFWRSQTCTVAHWGKEPNRAYIFVLKQSKTIAQSQVNVSQIDQIYVTANSAGKGTEAIGIRSGRERTNRTPTNWWRRGRRVDERRATELP